MMPHDNPPPLKLSLTEFPRATRESYKLCLQYRQLSKSVPRGNGEPVMCISGYGAGDGSMLPMRSFLGSIGYQPVKAGIGINIESKEQRIRSVDDATRFRDVMAERLRDRIEQVHEQYQQKLILIGWSMGGLFAIDISQQMPDKISKVVTLGSPFGDPRGTSTFNLMRWLNKSDIPVKDQDFESWLNRREIKAENVPVKVLFSKSDGIVGESTARLFEHPAVEHIEVESSHMGFAINPAAFKTIANCLKN